MSGRLPYVKRKFYPHMIGEESDIWNRFIDAYPDIFNTVDYDFRVGEGAITPDDLDENYKRMVTMLSQKRIDVLGWIGDSPTIIEVKSRVGLSTLGQILGYRTLFMNDFAHLGVPGCLVVCEVISSDDRFILEHYTIKIVVV